MVDVEVQWEHLKETNEPKSAGAQAINIELDIKISNQFNTNLIDRKTIQWDKI